MMQERLVQVAAESILAAMLPIGVIIVRSGNETEPIVRPSDLAGWGFSLAMLGIASALAIRLNHPETSSGKALLLAAFAGLALFVFTLLMSSVIVTDGTGVGHWILALCFSLSAIGVAFLLAAGTELAATS